MDLYPPVKEPKATTRSQKQIASSRDKRPASRLELVGVAEKCHTGNPRRRKPTPKSRLPESLPTHQHKSHPAVSAGADRLDK